MLIKTKKWLKQHRKIVVIVGVTTIVLTGAWAIQYEANPNSSRLNRDTSKQDEAPLTLPGLLTGIEVDPKIARRPVTGVMIENSPNARPQSGLDSAGIVFETVTEGGITRFLALYQEETPEKVGPVRSLRVPFVDWYQGFNSSIAHVGGSAEALRLIQQRSSRSLTQFMHGDRYYRSSDRPAPHNVYTSIGGLRDLQISMGYDKSEFKVIPRSNDSPSENPTAETIKIDYSSSLYAAEFRYRKNSNDYVRYLAGTPHIDRETNNPISTDNVVVVKMPSRQNGQYVDMDTIGSGDAVLFKDGRAHNVRWNQRSYRDRIELLDSDGVEMPLNRGKTWFAVLQTGRNLSY